MWRKPWILVIAVLLVGLSFVLTSEAAAQQKVITLIGQSHQVPGSPEYESLDRLAKKVEVASGGRLVMKVNPVGALCPGTREFDAVNTGVLDFASNPFTYNKDKWPAAPLFTCKAGGMNAHEKGVWLTNGGGQALVDEMLMNYNVVNVNAAGTLLPPEIFLVTNKPLEKLEDFKGLRVRSAGDGAAIMDRMGAACSLTPVGEVFEAMHRGVIDAFEVGSPTINWSMGLQEAGKYIYLSPARSSHEWNPIIFNKKKWEALPDDLKQIIETACGEEMYRCYSEVVTNDVKALENFREAGLTILPLPKVIEEAFLKEAEAFYAEESKKDPFTAKVVESQDSFLKTYREVWPRY